MLWFSCADIVFVHAGVGDKWFSPQIVCQWFANNAPQISRLNASSLLTHLGLPMQIWNGFPRQQQTD